MRVDGFNLFPDSPEPAKKKTKAKAKPKKLRMAEFNKLTQLIAASAIKEEFGQMPKRPARSSESDDLTGGFDPGTPIGRIMPDPNTREQWMMTAEGWKSLTQAAQASAQQQRPFEASAQQQRPFLNIPVMRSSKKPKSKPQPAPEARPAFSKNGRCIRLPDEPPEESS